MRHVVLRPVVWVYRIFAYYLKSGRIFGKKLREHKMRVFICVQHLSETFLIIRRIKRGIISCKVCVIHVRCSKNTHISIFMKIRPVEAELFHADGRTDTNFANAPKKSALMLRFCPYVREIIPATKPLLEIS
jgi:hypothetical protein